MTLLIFKTVHGSRLYGLSHEGSDEDTYMVTTSTRTRARHNLSGNQDVVSVGFDDYLTKVFEGSHQAVEALFSPYKVWGESEHGVAWRDYLANLKIAGPMVYAKYERTIKTFCFGDFKRRRHAVRLALNLADLRSEGRFNPVMGPWEVAKANTWADRFEGQELWRILTSRL